jgi:hypothetical protein
MSVSARFSGRCPDWGRVNCLTRFHVPRFGLSVRERELHASILLKNRHPRGMTVHNGLFMRAIVDADDPQARIFELDLIMFCIDFGGVLGQRG